MESFYRVPTMEKILKRKYPASDNIILDETAKIIYVIKEVDTKSKKEKRLKVIKSFLCDIITVKNIKYVKLNANYNDLIDLGIDTTKQDDDQLEDAAD